MCILLEIDCLVRRGELLKQESDLKSALEDLTAVERLCIEFPEKNLSTLRSTIFQTGICQMESKEYAEAEISFKKAQKMFIDQLMEQMKAAGKDIDNKSQPITELVKPSIFDTEDSKITKEFIVDLQNYITELDFIKANQAQMKEVFQKPEEKGASKEDNTVPAGFGKPMENADQFKTTGFTIKSKKRPISQITTDPNAASTTTEATQRTNQEEKVSEKVQKLEVPLAPTKEADN